METLHLAWYADCSGWCLRVWKHSGSSSGTYPQKLFTVLGNSQVSSLNLGNEETLIIASGFQFEVMFGFLKKTFRVFCSSEHNSWNTWECHLLRLFCNLLMLSNTQSTINVMPNGYWISVVLSPSLTYTIDAVLPCSLLWDAYLNGVFNCTAWYWERRSMSLHRWAVLPVLMSRA